jgi:kynurenine formamidase
MAGDEGQAREVISFEELLRDTPRNWGRWGADDEVGALNFLTPDVIAAAASTVKQGKVFTLQVKMANPDGDPVWPSRAPAQRAMVMDASRYSSGKFKPSPGGQKYADDVLFFFPQGTTQYDALGHAWYGDKIWNGYDETTTNGGLARASVLAIAERGVVGRGVLIDMARHRGKDTLDKGEWFGLDDLLACAKAQGVTIQKRDILVIRTGFIGSFYRDKEAFFAKPFNEPGLAYSPELVQWFYDMEIPNLVTDTIANEVTIDPVTGCWLILHMALMRDMGVVLTEIAWLDDLAADCAADGQYEFLYTAAPLKIVQGAGAPVNPVVIK